MPEIGIVETKSIIKTIFEKYHFDFSDYALTSFKRRIEHIIEVYNLKYADILIHKLIEDPKFFDFVLGNLLVPSSEMFRDPSVWRLLHDEIIPGILKESREPLKIWLPNSVSGDELFSLAIMLREMDLLQQTEIYVSCLCTQNIETIKSGDLESGKLEISIDNYTRANGKYDLPKYYSISNNKVIRDTTLIRDVHFSIQNESGEPVPQGIRLILFRNKMIYFNQVLQTKFLKNIAQALVPGGHLIIGTKESLSNLYGPPGFLKIYSNESIYKRKE